MSRRNWPDWWDWELELSPHLLKRMVDRRFSEVDLRRMLGDAHAIRPDIVPGRWIVESRFSRRPWSIVLEPDAKSKTLVVVTAYPVDR
jgi:hypothetical protein